jgi:hypothetical protein
VRCIGILLTNEAASAVPVFHAYSRSEQQQFHRGERRIVSFRLIAS